MKDKEIIEELAKDFYTNENQLMERIAFKRGYTECEENSYSYDEVLNILVRAAYEVEYDISLSPEKGKKLYKEWFEEYKKGDKNLSTERTAFQSTERFCRRL